MKDLTVRPAQPDDAASWRAARRELWPEDADAPRPDSVDRYFDGDPSAVAWAGGPSTVFVAIDSRGRLIGFAEVGTRPLTESLDESLVAYLEGWWVAPHARRRGVGTALIESAERWALDHGFHQLASDCLVSNVVSHQAHRAVGFVETERLIHFVKLLPLEH